MAKKKETLTPKEHLQAALVPEGEQPYPVPENWCWTKIGCLVQILNGFAFKSQAYTDSGIRIIRISNVQDGYIEDDKPVFYPLDSTDSIAAFILKDKDLLMSLTGNVGRVAIIDNSMLPAALNQRVACIRMLYPDYNKYFLFYYFLRKEFIQDCVKNSKGSAQLNMSTEWLKKYPIPLPPLAEQQRIVDRIESLFAKLDEAKQKAQDALDSFETRKAAILHKAFTGELTARWRKEHGVGMESWDSKPLLRVTKNHDSERIPLSQTERSELARVYDYYGASGVIDKVDRFLFEGRKLLIGEDGANLVTRSKPIAFIAEGRYWVNNHAHVLSVTSEMLLDFLCHYINSIDLTPYVTGSAQPKMTQAKMNSIPIPVPHISEQTEIVRLLDDLLAKEQQAKEAAEGVLEQIDLIKKAILARAFRGELGTNDPSEESAQELMKKFCFKNAAERES